MIGFKETKHPQVIRSSESQRLYRKPSTMESESEHIAHFEVSINCRQDCTFYSIDLFLCLASTMSSLHAVVARKPVHWRCRLLTFLVFIRLSEAHGWSNCGRDVRSGRGIKRHASAYCVLFNCRPLWTADNASNVFPLE